MPEVLVEDKGRARYLTLNRPEKRNALNDALVSKLKEELLAANEVESLRAIVIRGAGNDFCSGADLSALQKIANASFEENLDDARSLAELMAIPRSMNVPVIAAVHGRALAGGCGLATACDLVVAARSARFGYPEVKIGFVPAIVLAFLRRSVGEKTAFELTTQGFEFTAEKALDLGIINKCFPDESFEIDLLEYVSIYEKVSKSAVQLSKRLLYEMDSRSFNDAIEIGSRMNAEARMTSDCQHGIRRFLEKADSKST